jgi:hypothetical protein
VAGKESEIRAHLVALVSKPAPAKLTHFENLALSKLGGLTIPVSKSGRLFGCSPSFKTGVAETILSSGGHNFIVLSILSSKDMYYELNATIILDLYSNIHP